VEAWNFERWTFDEARKLNDCDVVLDYVLLFNCMHQYYGLNDVLDDLLSGAPIVGLGGMEQLSSVLTLRFRSDPINEKNDTLRSGTIV
jgi:hypothetical protein